MNSPRRSGVRILFALAENTERSRDESAPRFRDGVLSYVSTSPWANFSANDPENGVTASLPGIFSPTVQRSNAPPFGPHSGVCFRVLPRTTG
jgi:hypothetical protein